MRSRHLTAAAVLLLTLGVPQGAFASPNVLGSSSGVLSITDSSCSNPADDGLSTPTITLNINTQSGNNIGGNGSSNDGDQFTFSGGTVGVFSGVTFIQFSFSGSNSIDGVTFSGFLSADLQNGAWVVNSLSGSASDGCSFSGSGSLLLGGGGILGPGSSGVLGTTLFTMQVFVATYTVLLATHLATLFAPGPGGVIPVSDGFMIESPRGRAAGGGFDSLGVWGSLARSEFDNDFAATAYDGSRVTLLGGVDFSPMEDVVTGVAIGYDTADMTTTFNGGEQQTDGWTVAPYAAALLDDNWSVDVSAGLSRVGTDQFRTAGATRVNSDVDTNRIFASVNLSGSYAAGDWNFGPHLGWSLARSYDDSFVESNGAAVGSRVTRLEQWRIGGEAAYAGAGDFEPFARATYERDYSFTKIRVAGATQPANDRDDVLLATGVRYFGDNGLTGSIDWSKRLGRGDIGESQLSFALRYDF